MPILNETDLRAAIVEGSREYLKAEAAGGTIRRFRNQIIFPNAVELDGAIVDLDAMANAIIKKVSAPK